MGVRIHRLYADKAGISHFDDLKIELGKVAPGGRLSARLPATGIIFREVRAGYRLDWHPVPRRQYMINLDAGVRITASDGETRLIDVGEVLLAEDTLGQGHLSEGVGTRSRKSILVTLD